MSRPIKIRNLIIPHEEMIFRPEPEVKRGKEKVILSSDEYEAIKLVDYENMHHAQAAKILGISRPTFSKMYEKVRYKIATSLVEKKELKIEKGYGVKNDIWFRCKNCSTLFNIPVNFKGRKICPVCFSKLIGELK